MYKERCLVHGKVNLSKKEAKKLIRREPSMTYYKCISLKYFHLAHKKKSQRGKGKYKFFNKGANLMPREIIVTINDDGTMSVEGKGLKPGERIEDVAKFVTDQIAEVTEFGHLHEHKTTEVQRQIQK